MLSDTSIIINTLLILLSFDFVSKIHSIIVKVHCKLPKCVKTVPDMYGIFSILLLQRELYVRKDRLVLIESQMSASEYTCCMARGDAATRVIEVK